jgi:hypothetical protein
MFWVARKPEEGTTASADEEIVIENPITLEADVKTPTGS